MSEIQKFDLTTVIRERVRSVIFDAIPDDEIDAMIKAEFQAYFQEYRRHRHASNLEPSRFSVLVRECVTETMTEKTRDWLSENFEQIWTVEGGTLIGDLVVEFVPIVQARMTFDIVSRALSEIQNQINQYGQR